MRDATDVDDVRSVDAQEALRIEPDEGVPVKRLLNGIKRLLKKENLQNFDVRQDPSAEAVWLLRKASATQTPPAAPEQNGRAAAPFAGAPAVARPSR